MGFPAITLNPSELLASLLPKATFIGDVEIDVLTLEEKLLEWESTERPVDQGLDITDTRKKRPNFVRITGWLTNDDLQPEAIGTSFLAGEPFEFKTAAEKKLELESVADSNEVIQITTRNNVFETMQIRSLKETVTKDTGGYSFVMEARQIRQVSSDTSLVDPSLVPKALQDVQTDGQKAAEAKGKPPSNGGNKPTKPAAPKDVDPLRSVVRFLGGDV